MDRLQKKRLERAIQKAMAEPEKPMTFQGASQITMRPVSLEHSRVAIELQDLSLEIQQPHVEITDSYLEELPFHDVPLPYYTEYGIIEHTYPEIIVP